MTPAHAVADRKQTGSKIHRGRQPHRSYSRAGDVRRRNYLNPAQLVLDVEFPPAVRQPDRRRSRPRNSTAYVSETPSPGELFRHSDVALAVMAFHASFGLPQKAKPTIDVDPTVADLRINLLEEEVGEFASATRSRDLVAIADALADIAYVTYGAALTYGIDLDAVLSEVHRANMSKLDKNGHPVLRADGKVMKSKRYRPPDVAGTLLQQLPLPLMPYVTVQ